MKIKDIDIVTVPDSIIEYCDITVECEHGFTQVVSRNAFDFIKWLIEKYEQEIIKEVVTNEEI